MSGPVLKPSELKFFLQRNGIKNYKWKSFLSGGSFPKMLLEDAVNKREVIGKIVSLPSEGELKFWPQLRHQNLNPLLEILSVGSDDTVRILISPAVGKCIATAIDDISFREHPLCFERKKSYAKDILLAIDYMHRNSFYLLNLSGWTVEIHTHEDRAVICDFSCTVDQRSVPKASLSRTCYIPPEVENANDADILYCSPIDMWYCGLLFLQIFTQYLLPWRDVVKDSLYYLDSEVLRKANIGSCLQRQDATDVQRFLKKFLAPTPRFRLSASEACNSSFLQAVQNRMDEKARRFWKNGGRTVCQNSENAWKEKTNYTSIEEDSLCSEIDATTVSESSTPRNCHYEEASCPLVNERYLSRTKSEPGGKINRKTRSPSFQLSVSFPSFSKKCNSTYSLTPEGTVVSEIESAEIETYMLLDNFLYKKDYEIEPDHEIRTAPNVFNKSKRRQGNPYDVFRTEWEADILTNIREDSAKCMEMETGLENDNNLENSFTKRVKEMPSEKNSKNHLIADRISAESNISARGRRKRIISHEVSRLESNDPEIAEGYNNDYLPFEIQKQKSCSDALPINSNFQSHTMSISTSADFPSGSNNCLEMPMKPASPNPGIHLPSPKLDENENCTPCETSPKAEEFKRCGRMIRSSFGGRNPNHSLDCASSPVSSMTENMHVKGRDGGLSFKDSANSMTKGIKETCAQCHSKVKGSPVESDTKIEKQLSTERSKSPDRRKWYHKLCFGFKKK